MNLKCLIVADSLSMPRPDLNYVETWYYLVQQQLPNLHFIPKLQRGLNSNMLFVGAKGDYLEFYQPDIVILQVGIVDCAPRLFKSKSKVVSLINSLPMWLRNHTWRLIKKYRVRSEKYCDVPADSFELNLRNYLIRCVGCSVKQVYVIKILSPNKEMILKNPFIRKQVDLYNNILDTLAEKYSLVKTLDLNLESSVDLFGEDGYHLNKAGSNLLANSIIKEIKNTLIN